MYLRVGSARFITQEATQSTTKRNTKYIGLEDNKMEMG